MADAMDATASLKPVSSLMGMGRVFPPTSHGRPSYLPNEPKINRRADNTDITKHSFFLAHRAAAREGWEGGQTVEFAEQSPLMKELRMVFDWICQEKGAMKVASRDFKQRLPVIHKKFPQMSSSFARMDANGDCWLEWEEFIAFCMKDERLYRMLKRAATINVYGREQNGALTHKDLLDPAHSCEMSPSPPILPWETAHVVEWRIEGLKLHWESMRGKYGGTTVQPGSPIASPPFRAAGVCGFIRFWPLGYWTETTRRKKISAIPATEDLVAAGCRVPPAAGAWCCIGACLPAGTHLEVRFYVGDLVSKPREVFWNEGTHVNQLWAPPAGKPPAELLGAGSDKPFVVGIEILRNRSEQKNMRPRPKQMDDVARLQVRPHMLEGSSEAPRSSSGSVLLGRAKSVPSLKRSSSSPSMSGAGSTAKQQTSRLLPSSSGGSLSGGSSRILPGLQNASVLGLPGKMF